MFLYNGLNYIRELFRWIGNEKNFVDKPPLWCFVG